MCQLAIGKRAQFVQLKRAMVFVAKKFPSSPRIKMSVRQPVVLDHSYPPASSQACDIPEKRQLLRNVDRADEQNERQPVFLCKRQKMRVVRVSIVECKTAGLWRPRWRVVWKAE